VFNHELYASAFGRAVDVMRSSPPNKDHQKAALRALVALASLAAASLRLYEGVLSVDDVPIPDSVPNVSLLAERLRVHRVSELLIGRGSEPAELLAIMRGLAAEPGAGGSLKVRLRDARSTRVMLILEQTGPEPRPRSVSQAIDLSDIEEAERRAWADMGEPAAPPAPTAPPLPTPAAAAAAARAPEAPPREPKPAPKDEVLEGWDAQHSSGAAVPSDGMPMPGVLLTFDAEHMPVRPAESVPAQLPRPIAPPPPPVPLPPPPDLPIDRDSPMGSALAAVVLDPYGRAVLDRLAALGDAVSAALRDDQLDAALRVLSVLIDLEPGAPEGTPRASYAIVLQRTLTQEVLAQLAPCLHNPALNEPATKVLRRARAEGVELLLGLLASADNLRERKAYMAVLRGIPQGKDKVLEMLDHPQWFVVRNVAELAGELRVEEAVPDLGRLLTHHDQRVRRTAAVALAKVASVTTVEPLRRALKDGNAEMRALIASSIEGGHARALAMPLVGLCETESDPVVLREYLRALGRIGTPEAVQALARAAEPGGRVLGRKSVANRLAAVEGLRLAGPAAGAVLQALADDADKAVREAVQKALRPRA